MQVFALYLRSRGPLPATQPHPTTASDVQAVLLYAATTISYFAKYFTGEHTTVTDAAGVTWRTADIYETSVLLTVYGMVFIALLALLRIAQRRSTAPGSAPEAGTTQSTSDTTTASVRPQR
jgi:putative membrane protein